MSLTGITSIGAANFSKGTPGNGLSVSALSSASFSTADQPILLYEYEANNLIPNSDMAGAVVSTTPPTGWESNDATVISAVAGPDGNGDYTITCTTVPAATAKFIRDFCIVSVGDVVIASVDYNLTAGSCNYRDILFPLYQASTFWNDGTVVSGTATVTAPQSGTLQVLCTATTTAIEIRVGNSLGGNAANTTVEVTKPYVRYFSSPDTYVQTTGTATAVASYGDIQFADAVAGTDAYTLTATISDGDMTVASGYESLGANALNWTVGDGTADATFTASGDTLADLNAAFLGLSVDNVATGVATLSGTLTHDASGRIKAFSVELRSIGDLLLVSDGTSYLLLSNGIDRLSLSN